MHILFCASEVAPLAKVGGLADVAGSLPKALASLGHTVTVVMPKYDIIDTQQYPVTKILSNVPVAIGQTTEKVSVWKTTLPNSTVPVYLLENDAYLKTGGVYFDSTAFVGSFREIQRFVFFCHAIVALVHEGEMAPDILHCHDWHTALLPTLMAENEKKIPTLLTIHNLANQGKWQRNEVEKWLNISTATWAGTETEVNILEQGIVSATFLSTVSPSYAKEILTPDYSENLETSLHARRKKLMGILNGIDQDRYNPETDPAVLFHYDKDTVAIEKPKNKGALQKQFSLPVKDVPVIGMVTRITDQKGFDLILPILPELFHEEVQVVILGTGDPKIEQQLQQLQKNFPENLSLELAFDATGGRHIYAGADMFWMPSRFEPCGLGQLIAMRYGTIPIVRATGGLKDTVTPYSPETPQGRGFVFEDYTSDALLKTTQHALQVIKDPVAWQRIIQNDIANDSSWTQSAKAYSRLYEKIITS